MIRQAHIFTHPQLPGVTVIPIQQDELHRNEFQQVLVRLEPNARIPLHSHAGMAIMDPVCGSAHVLSEDEDNGRRVAVGDRVIFEATKPHGFQAGERGFAFISTNEGIVDASGEWDISFQ